MSKMLAGFCAGILVTGACAYWLWPRGAALAEDRRADTPVAKGPALPRRPADRERPARLESRSREDARASDPVVDSQAPSAVTNTSHTGNPGSSLEFPGGSLETQRSGDVDPLDKLLNSMRVYCLFDPGAGAFWAKGQLAPHSAAWQGGPIDFESIDLVEKTAQMLGSQGATGSLEGKMQVRVTATDSGLHFSGFKSDGELIAITVYGALDAQGRHRAVMSGHGTRFDYESSQFYGGCSVR